MYESQLIEMHWCKICIEGKIDGLRVCVYLAFYISFKNIVKSLITLTTIVSVFADLTENNE